MIVTYLKRPAKGVTGAIGIPPGGNASWTFVSNAARHKVGLSDTHCVITSSNVSGGGLKICLFSENKYEINCMNKNLV
jgi:hypothetical protein